MIHPTACIDQGARIGDGTKIWHFCHVREGATVGSNCVLGQNVYVDAGVEIGDGVKIQNNVSIYRGVVIEDGVFLGPSCVFTNVGRPRSDFPVDASSYGLTVVKRGATVGANATVVCGHTIGEWGFVGAGAVVTRDVRPYSMVLGVPARHVGWVCCCGRSVSLEHDLTDHVCQCGQRFSLQSARLVRR